MRRVQWLAAMFDEESDAILADDAYGRVQVSLKKVKARIAEREADPFLEQIKENQ